MATSPDREGATVQLTLSEAELDDILYMREEKKLARDAYLTLHEQWGTPVFANISWAEQRHMDRMLGLVEHYGLVDPVTETASAYSSMRSCSHCTMHWWRVAGAASWTCSLWTH